MDTAFTRLLSCKWPLVSAAMTGTAGGSLAAAVTQAGGFGFLACFDLPILQAELQTARDELGLSSDDRLPIGAGFLGWLLDTRPELQLDEGIDLAMRSVSAIWLSFGRDLGKWGRKIKAPPDADQVKLFILVSNVEQGLAALEFGADVIIAQGKRFAQIMPHLQERTGSEAGGHGSSKGMPLLTFLPLLISALPPSHPPVLAAGGIATGAHIAAARCLGADGVVMGTRFLACPESGYSEPQKQAILDGKGSCTVRSVLFDQLTDMMDWPDDIDGRSLINQTFIESLEGKRSMAELKADYAKALEGKDTSRIVVWAGTSVGLVNSRMGAAEIVDECGQEAVAVLQGVAMRRE